jgi:hypothetical protein
MIIALVIITVDTIMHNQVSIVINVIIIIITISSSKNMLDNQSSSPPPSTASKRSSFHHHNHNRHHHNFQETLVTSRRRKHQRGKKNAAYQCQTKPITTKIRFNKIKHAPHQNFTQHTSQSRFNAIAIAIAAKSNSGIRLQFVNNMHNSNKKRNFKAMQNQHQINNSNRAKRNNRNLKPMMTITKSNDAVTIASIVHATITRLMSSNMRKNQRITTSSAWNETKIFPTLRTLLS